MLLLLSCGDVQAQNGGAWGNRDRAFAGGELERYLRPLQVLGQVPSYPWGIRGFSVGELRSLAPVDSVHPWAERNYFPPDPENGPVLAVLPVSVRGIYNTRFPYGSNDGPIWAGRGLTTSVSAGVVGAYGPVSLVLAPLAFRAENEDFPIEPNGRPKAQRFGHSWGVLRIDAPQRFGEDPYTRIDPGQSTLRVELKGMAAGVSTANHIWGPGDEHPIMLGTNAPGFPHLFLGTSHPVDVGLGRLHGQVLWASMSESPYSIMFDDPRSRVAAGFAAVFSPARLGGLEIGLTRMFHGLLEPGESRWQVIGVPFQALFASSLLPSGGLRDKARTNQVVSVFARWPFSPAGLEVYGEYGRNDHSYDVRDFLLEPDQQRAYMVGFLKAWSLRPDRLVALRGELINSQVSHIVQVRHQAPFYGHGTVRQGHTNRGQILGSAAGFDGGGSVVSADYYDERGRWTLTWSRAMNDRFDDPLPVEADVQHSFGLERLLFRDRLELTAGVDLVYHLNRNFQGDAFNFSGTLGARLGF